MIEMDVNEYIELELMQIQNKADPYVGTETLGELFSLAYKLTPERYTVMERAKLTIADVRDQVLGPAEELEKEVPLPTVKDVVEEYFTDTCDWTASEFEERIKDFSKGELANYIAVYAKPVKWFILTEENQREVHSGVLGLSKTKKRYVPFVELPNDLKIELVQISEKYKIPYGWCWQMFMELYNKRDANGWDNGYKALRELQQGLQNKQWSW
ncbi:MAG: hypothetical protein ACYDEF_14700 [Methanosarcina sp.]